MPVRTRSRVFHLRDDLLARSADSAQLVELRVDAVAHEAAVPRQGRHLVGERRLDGVADVDQIVELAFERAHQRRLQLGEDDADAGDAQNRLLEADEVARSGRTERGAGNKALQVLDGLHRLAKLAALSCPIGELLDGIKTIADGFEGDEWCEQPCAKQAAAHRR